MPDKRPLQGCSVLVTRPKNQANALIELLKDQGATVLHQPAMTISAEPLAAQQSQIRRINNYDWLIFISKNAVEYGLNVIETGQTLNPSLKIAAIGKATCTALNLRGYNSIFCPAEGYDSEALLASDAFSADQIQAKKVLIIRGGQGREHLRETLEQRSASVVYLDVYQRHPATLQLSPTALQKLDIITISSQQGLEYLLSLVDTMTAKTMLDKLLIVPSERCYNRAVELGFKEIEIAANATDNAMLNCITHKIKA